MTPPRALVRPIALLLVITACAGATQTPSSELTEASIEVGGEALTVWVADTSEERNRGLRGVESLPNAIDGMLFVYGSPTYVTYGMLNTPMPLDIWWFDSTGILFGRTEMEPCNAEPCTDYRLPGAVVWVLETPQGVYEFVMGATLSTVEKG